MSEGTIGIIIGASVAILYLTGYFIVQKIRKNMQQKAYDKQLNG